MFHIYIMVITVSRTIILCKLLLFKVVTEAELFYPGTTRAQAQVSPGLDTPDTGDKIYNT